MKTAIQILRGVIAMLLALLIAGNLWMMVQQSLLKKDPPELFGYSQLVVTSGSMEPAFSAGDMIVIHAEEEYQLGDIVTFRNENGDLVTHRIIGSTEGSFITKGDANNVEDDTLLLPQNIVGKLVTYLPMAGSLLLFLRTPVGVGALLVLGFLLIELPSLFGSVREKGRHAK